MTTFKIRYSLHLTFNGRNVNRSTTLTAKRKVTGNEKPSGNQIWSQHMKSKILPRLTGVNVLTPQHGTK